MLLPVATCLAFVVIAAWHFYVAVVPGTSHSWAIPNLEGKPLFRPSRMGTAAVALMLLAFAALVAACARIWAVGVPHRLLLWLSYALAAALCCRAIGDFRYVGFFKQVRGTAFARLDSLLFSPLCLLLAAGVGVTAFQSAP